VEEAVNVERGLHTCIKRGVDSDGGIVAVPYILGAISFAGIAVIMMLMRTWSQPVSRWAIANWSKQRSCGKQFPPRELLV